MKPGSKRFCPRCGSSELFRSHRQMTAHLKSLLISVLFVGLFPNIAIAQIAGTGPDRTPLRPRRSQNGICMKWTTFIAYGVEQLADFVVVPTEFSLGDNRGMKLT